MRLLVRVRVQRCLRCCFGGGCGEEGSLVGTADGDGRTSVQASAARFFKVALQRQRDRG